ncbi:MAG: alpha/beta fold hydrolase [Candidatus Aminicenantia bacterium]
MEERYKKISKYQVCYWEEGNGPPVILLHGIGASKEWWQYNILTLAQKYQVYAPDFIGFGRSDKPRVNYDFNFSNNFLNNFLREFNLQKVSLVGNSMGGLMALQFAICFPEKATKLVLVSNVGFGQKLTFISRIATIFPVGELAFSIANYHTTRMLLGRLFYDSRKLPNELIQKVMEITRLPQTKSIPLFILRQGVNLKGLRSEIYQPLIEQISTLKIPTLIVWGKEDKIIPVSQAHLGHKLIENSKIHIFDRCGHVPQIEKAEEFNELILNFLD